MVRLAPGASEARVYDISGRRPKPLQANLNVGSRSAAAQKRARRKLELQNTETDLIQDFAFPTVSRRIKVSPDGRYLFASGTYPPQLHVYDTEELSLKFKRHINNDIVDFQVLESDWRKFALLTADRYIDLHSPFGSHFKTRIPRCGRDLMLHRGTCELYMCGEGADVWRLNLEHGRFMAPLPTQSGMNGGNNVCGINPVNSLLAFGGETALLDIWDPRTAGRTRKPAATHDVGRALADHTGAILPPDTEICALRFDESDGVTLAVGTTTGHSLLFDLRSRKPMLVRDQGNGLPIRSIRMHEDGKHCLSADPKSIKVWQRTSGINEVAIEPDADINHLCIIGNSGVMCAAVESQRVKTYYVPALGPAPRWCAFLDTFTEELEDGRRIKDGTKASVEAEHVDEAYENYKFVSHDELEGLGLAHLVGTDMLKAYMHGYFVHQKLYRRAVDVSEPFAYERYRKEKARAKLEAERQSRITKVKSKAAKKKVDVNQKVVDTLQERQKSGKKSATTAMSILEDDRFSAMFSNKDYAVEEDAERFQYLNPSGTGGAKRKPVDDSDSDEEYLERFDLVDDGDVASHGENVTEEASSDDGSADDDDDVALESGEESDVDAQGVEQGSERIRSTKRQRPKAPRMYEIGRVGEIVGTSELRNPEGRALRRKIRDELALGTRVKSALKMEYQERNNSVDDHEGRRRRRSLKR